MFKCVHPFLLQNILLVQRQMSVKESDVEQFQQDLKIYTEATCSQLDNLQYVPTPRPQPPLTSRCFWPYALTNDA